VVAVGESVAVSSVSDPLARTGIVGAVRGASGPLLERAGELVLLSEELHAVAGSGRGRLVLVTGEAGIGKTALVSAFCARLAGVRVLSGACDALLTPRPLGPMVDIAEQAGGRLAAAIQTGAGPSELLAVVASELRRRSPSVVVLEDLHWGDGATFDLFRLLARRVETLPALVVVTYRNDELDREHPLRVALGDVSAGTMRRVALAPLSARAVAELASPHVVDAVRLHIRTGGNPFFVTEVLAAGGLVLPDTVRDAVLARASRLDDTARGLLEAVAIVQHHAEMWLLEALAPDQLPAVERCIASGMLHSVGDGVAFRHEIARAAIEGVLPPDRALTLHRRAQRALVAPPSGRQDFARIAHHAEAAGDVEAVLEFAVAAGAEASALGAHGEAAAQYARALRFADALSSERRAELFERRSYECYLIDAISEAIEARQAALAEHRARGDLRREGDAHSWLSRLAWYAGDSRTVEIEGRLAIKQLEQIPAGPELARAYSNMSSSRMLASDLAGAKAWGERAIGLAEELDEPEILVHALANIGSAELRVGNRAGYQKLERSLAMARASELQDDVLRAYVHLGADAMLLHDYARGNRYFEEAVNYCRDHDLDTGRLYLIAWKAQLDLEQGRWDQAGSEAASVLDRPGVDWATRMTALLVVGSLRARRGDPDPWGPLDEAAALAANSGELIRVASVAAARAEARWLAGELPMVAVETDAALRLALDHESALELGPVLLWRWRAGIAPGPARPQVDEPYRLELEGEATAAAELWEQLGCPYEAALTLLQSNDQAAQRTAVSALQQLGARRAAARAARMLRAGGVRNVRQGPRPATRANPAGLTARELEVLELAATGLRNGEIAQRLVLSRRTVDAHMSAILRKLDVNNRTEAVVKASSLGIIIGS
jgi:DNA-binding CsgD family transcriptional regulator